MKRCADDELQLELAVMHKLLRLDAAAEYKFDFLLFFWLTPSERSNSMSLVWSHFVFVILWGALPSL